MINTMQKRMFQSILCLLLSLYLLPANAVDSEYLPDIKEGIVSIRLQEPGRAVGYTVGDVLTRHIIVTIQKPYLLIDESLPIVGYERRYKGQLVGVDLSAITHTKKEVPNAVEHDITLSYQVFTNNVVAKNATLPQEYLRLINPNAKVKEIVKYRIPYWNFAISPLSIFGAIKVENDMSEFRGPLLMDNSAAKIRLKVLLAVLTLSGLGLLYMLGKHTWLPRMGGPFAKSYRTIRQQANTAEGIQNAVTSMHQSLNATAGNSLFSGNLEAFLVKKPAFEAVKSEIEQFFALSRQVFFEPSAKHSIGDNPLVWLAQFSRRCRDCERGLVPDALQSTTGTIKV
jgi:mxaA protein